MNLPVEVDPALPLVFLGFGQAHVGMVLVAFDGSTDWELGPGPFLPAALRRSPRRATAAR